MNAVLGKMGSTAQELAHYHSGDGNTLPSYLKLQAINFFDDFTVVQSKWKIENPCSIIAIIL